jgi:hypothetical protein
LAQRPGYVTEEQQAAAADGISPSASVIAHLKMLHVFWALANTALSAGHHVVSKTLSPSIIYLIELEISRQFLGKLERVNWSKPLTEHNRYAAVMLLRNGSKFATHSKKSTAEPA